MPALDRQFHISAKAVGRAGGRSAVAAAAYRAGVRLVDERTGQVCDYGRKSRVVGAAIFAPDGCEWAQDRGLLWNAAEAADSRKNARLATELELALPHEMTRAQMGETLAAFARRIARQEGVAVDVAIHAPHREDAVQATGTDGVPLPGGDHRNFHAHVLVTHRQVTPDGMGDRRPAFDTPKKIETIRAAWAQCLNEAYQRFGIDKRADHRSYKAQGVDLEPTRHLGHRVVSAERQGYETEAATKWRAAKQAQAVQAEVIDLRAERERRRLEPAVRPTGGQPVDRRDAIKLRLLARRYQAAFPADLAPHLHQIVADDGRDSVLVRLRSGAAVEDRGDRIIQAGQTTQESARLTAELARAKGWTSVEVTGPSEYRQAVARAATRVGIAVSNADLAEVVADERRRMEAAFQAQARRPAPAAPPAPPKPAAADVARQTMQAAAYTAMPDAQDAVCDRLRVQVDDACRRLEDAERRQVAERLRHDPAAADYWRAALDRIQGPRSGPAEPANQPEHDHQPPTPRPW